MASIPGVGIATPAPVNTWEAVIEDLVPLSTQLLTPAVADAFDIPLPKPVGGQSSLPVAAAQPRATAENAHQRPSLSSRPSPTGGSQQMLFQNYLPPTSANPPQQPGNLQESPAQLQVPGLNQQLQSLGMQPQLFNLKPEEKNSQQGLANSSLHFPNWLDPGLPASRTHLPQSGAKHVPDPNVGSDPENGDDVQTRALKRPRLVWTAQLHQRFVDAVKQLGLKNAVPKTIMQLMNVDGLTRENVASHLQKYRLQLRKEEGRGDEQDKDDEDDNLGDAEVPQV